MPELEIIYTAAHAHFPDTEPLGGGKAVADYLCREQPGWSVISPRSLGIALARTDKGAEAIEAFNRIRDPKLGEVAKLWKLFIETKSQPAAAPAPAPAG